ncbi:MAG: GTP-binding protein, partial [Nocardioidaceae bacterium]
MRTLNLGIVAHVDAGKTSLTERILFEAGVLDEPGTVDAGNTHTDTMALERRRGITIRSAVVSFVVDDVTVNLIDTPGHADFIAEVERALAVLDGAILVVSAVEGVQAQTLVLFRALQRLGIPTLFFVNKVDRAGARPDGVLGEIAARLGPVVGLGT